MRGKGKGEKRGELPRHIAIIMDGNGRWAVRRGLPRVAGHQAGIQTVRNVVKACAEMGIEFLTLYAFSTENWKRPKHEVEFLFKLCEDYASREVSELNRGNVRLRFLGRREGLPDSLLRVVDRALELTKDNTGLTLNIALNYGGRAEMMDAIKGILAAYRDGQLNPDGLDEALLARYLYTAGLPDVDLLIRTAGEWRLSNFLLWQAVGAYFWVTPTFWPDFTPQHLQEAIEEWRKAKRREHGKREER